MPIFLPFAGCSLRCAFCAQHHQTGIAIRPDTTAVIRNTVSQLRAYIAHAHTPIEVGFFGGTFTALPEEDFKICLCALHAWREEGLVSHARCSTRPDADPGRLALLREAGFATVELGIQSFDHDALRSSRRGYSTDTALRACAQVRAAGLHLGVQLLPGMPGVSPAVFRRDVALALDAGAALLRFYPCLVLEGTDLAQWWRQGRYIPWTLAQVVDALADGWLAAQERHVPVIRMGLAPEPGLEDAVLAGPRHPALGALVQAEALYRAVERAARHAAENLAHAAGQAHTAPPNITASSLPLCTSPLLTGLSVPRHCRGFFWGHKGSLRLRWEALGITASSVRWHEGDTVELTLPGAATL